MNVERIPTSREELERRIQEYPPGYLSIKIIKGKERYYHQWYEGGRLHTKYVRAEDYPALRDRIEERKALQRRLMDLKNTLFDEPFRTDVVWGSQLREMSDLPEGTERRECFGRLRDYLGRRDAMVCVLYGLRRTGKTMMIYQALADMTDDELERTAYITVGTGNTMSDLRIDMNRLNSQGFDTFFVDEVTRLKDFVGFSYFFSDIMAARGARVVLTGTDSLSFRIAERQDMYGRTVMIHTTHIPYREHSRLLGIDDIDDYIRYGGIFRGGELEIEDPDASRDLMAFGTRQDVDDYIGLAVAGNIENTLEHTDSSRFGPLYQAHREGRFRDVINRLVEDINHRFLLSVLNEEFRSRDLENLERNLLQRRGLDDGTLDMVDWSAVLERLKATLDIRDRDDDRLDDAFVGKLREYLRDMDLFVDMPAVSEDPSEDLSGHTLCLQPGLRYFHAVAMIRALEDDESMAVLPVEVRDVVSEVARVTVAGHILEEAVLYDTMEAASGRLEVFKLFLNDGEVDMVVRDRDALTCVLVEVKHSDRRYGTQTRHLRNARITSYVESRFGRVVGRYVLYRGEDAEEGCVKYLNVEEYLGNLPGSAHRLFRPRCHRSGIG